MRLLPQNMTTGTPQLCERSVLATSDVRSLKNMSRPGAAHVVCRVQSDDLEEGSRTAIVCKMNEDNARGSHRLFQKRTRVEI